MAHERAEADAELDALAALGALANFASYVIKSTGLSFEKNNK